MSPYVKKVKQNKKILQQIVIDVFFFKLVLVFHFYREFWKFLCKYFKSIDFYIKINYAINKFK